MTGAKTLAAGAAMAVPLLVGWVLVPVRVRVRAPLPVKAMALAPPAVLPAMVRVALLPAAGLLSIVDVPVPRVNSRSVETDAAPVYRRVPPLRTRFCGALLDWPMPLADPPLARLFVARTAPPLIVVVPVQVLAPYRLNVPRTATSTLVVPPALGW